jgi:hypothetical protein
MLDFLFKPSVVPVFVKQGKKKIENKTYYLVIDTNLIV